jgi:hypothetical protein
LQVPSLSERRCAKISLICWEYLMQCVCMFSANAICGASIAGCGQQQCVIHCSILFSRHTLTQYLSEFIVHICYFAAIMLSIIFVFCAQFLHRRTSRLGSARQINCTFQQMWITTDWLARICHTEWKLYMRRHMSWFACWYFRRVCVCVCVCVDYTTIRHDSAWVQVRPSQSSVDPVRSDVFIKVVWRVLAITSQCCPDWWLCRVVSDPQLCFVMLIRCFSVDRFCEIVF